MKVPWSILIEIERVARLVLQGELSYEEAIDALEPLLEKDEHRLLLQDVKRRFLRQQIKRWITGQLATAADREEEGQQPLPYPDLPPLIEIAIGTFKHQNAMSDIKDWDAAVRQAQNKADNAAGHLERILRARERWIDMQKTGQQQAQ